MAFNETYQQKQKTPEAFLELLQDGDFLSTSIAVGQPRTLLNQLAQWKGKGPLKLFTGLLAFPYPCLTQENFHTISGYYGPLDRMLNQGKFNISYQPLPFRGFENFLCEKRPRISLTTLSAMDDEGFLSFGVNAEASYRPFVEAAQDPQRLAIAEINPKMPVVRGLPELGDNKIHIKDVDVVIESEQTLLQLPEIEPQATETQIAQNVVPLLQNGDTLQLGIGGIPNEVARLLTETDLGDFGIHSELISDGFLDLMESGKITNRKKTLNPGKSIFSFALGSQRLYDFLDERNGHNQGRVLAAPISYVNDPSLVARHKSFVSINSGFMIDLSGQVCSESIGERQYSGVGGQLEFVQGAFHSPGGRTILCFKSTYKKDGKIFSNITNHLPPGSIVSTPRHYVQWVVTEFGRVNLFALSDEERPWALIKIAHPDFKDELSQAAKKREDTVYFKR